MQGGFGIQNQHLLWDYVPIDIGIEEMSLIKIAEVGFLFWMVVPCILFAIRVIYQLDGIFVYFSSTCFGLTRPSSGAIEL